MKYTYILGILALASEISVAVDDVNVRLLSNGNESLSPKKQRAKDHKSSISAPVTKSDFAKLEVISLPEHLQQKAAIDFLYRLSKSDQLNMIFNKADTSERNKEKIRKYAIALESYLLKHKDTVTIENKVVQQFITGIGSILKKCPAVAGVLFNKPSSNTIIGLPYLCSKYLKNSELFLLFTSAILETSALEIACAMKDTEYMSPQELTNNNIEYRRWAVNVNTENAVEHLRNYAQKIFDLYADSQRDPCTKLRKSLFSNAQTSKYIRESQKYLLDYSNNLNAIKKQYENNSKMLASENAKAKQKYKNTFLHKVTALQEYLVIDNLKKDVEECISMTKTFYVDAVKKFSIDDISTDTYIKDLKRSLIHGHVNLMLDRFFMVNNTKVKDEEITQKSHDLYYSLLSDYSLDKFLAFFDILDSSQYYKKHSLDRMAKQFNKKCENKNMKSILNLINKNNRISKINDNLNELIMAYKIFEKQIEEIRRLLMNNLTSINGISNTKDESLELRLKALKLSLTAGASKNVHLYSSKQEINQLTEYVIQRIRDFITDTKKDEMPIQSDDTIVETNIIS